MRARAAWVRTSCSQSPVQPRSAPSTVGRAIAAAATAHAGAEPDDPTSFAMVPGRGVVAQVGGRTVYAGSARAAR